MKSKVEDLTLRIAIFDDGRQEDAEVRLLDVWFANAFRSKMTSVVLTERGKTPVVYRYIETGTIELPRPLRDRIVLICYDRLIRERLLVGPQCFRADVPNGLEWLRLQLTADDFDCMHHQMIRNFDPLTAAIKARWRFRSPKEL